VKHKTASSRAERTAQDPTRSTPRKAAEAEVKDQKPKAPKPRTGSTAARLAPEIERLSAELAASRLRIGELENRVDVDPLTQTFNRRGFERALARSLAYVKRYDEFVVLLWNMTEADALSKAAALEKAVYATPVRWGASTMVVGASAGVAVIGPLDTPADVLTRADAAMYARKMKRKESHSPPHAAHAS
jgi:GGDEF domain-containing protein